MTQDEQLAAAAIRKTLATCTQAGDARKAEGYAACFTEAGVLHLASGRIEGRAAIRAWMAAPSVIPQPHGAVSPGFVSHHLTTCRIDQESADSAAVRTYWLVITAIGLDHSGYYADRFERVGEDWLLAYRRPRTLWVSTGSLVAGEVQMS